ncbi:LLM class flavin-dependent oxidoreductase [Marininema halotolerans]|uniref:Alkanesulfonate monooxygenase n=1 Tax=Marininema halotolerans TaxID=1155944 RepID=A0A1I6PW00_9BACL|nr:LLM class flavin-dependent oxidoreductase [Marininema halotolerans]SFS44373.1 alkanesulfonate monooxygenase [Marininema halotolerans]
MMEFCWGLPVIPTPQTKDLLDAYIDQSKRAEANGFDSVLVSVAPTSVDPFVASTLIGMNTESIRILVAQNTNQMLPTVTAKAVHTLNQLIGDRVDVNVVTGSASMVLARDGKPEPHGVRYQRTKEYIDLIQQLRRGVTTYAGRFYQVENSDIYPKENPEHRARYFIAGSSEAAMQVAAEHGDAYILYATDRNTLKEHFTKVQNYGKEYGHSDIPCAVLVDIIARETTEEAFQTANELLERTPTTLKRMTKLFLKNADSVGLSRYKNLRKEDDYWVDEHLWGGLSVVNPSNSVSIVGSYPDVIATLLDFRRAGASYFLLTSQMSDTEIERIGQHVLRPLKETAIKSPV